MKGLFIALEGPDGSGKSTISNKIEEYFKKEKINYLMTREPGGSEIGEKIRDLILDENNTNMCDETEALLYAASRSQHVGEKILPALEGGKVVVSDRFIWSSLAYQGVGRDLGIEDVGFINDFGMRGVYPDLILFFHIDPELTLERKTKDLGGDRLEQEGKDFHKKVYEGYMELLDRYPKNVKLIDARKSIDEVYEQAIGEIKKAIQGRA